MIYYGSDHLALVEINARLCVSEKLKNGEEKWSWSLHLIMSLNVSPLIVPIDLWLLLHKAKLRRTLHIVPTPPSHQKMASAIVGDLLGNTQLSNF